MILEQVKQKQETIDFKEVIAYIDEHYDFTPTKFKNGNTINEANENNGSCKMFSFAKLNDLSKEETLSLFGAFYKEDVLKNPEGNNHQNIRNFMEFGWAGVVFDGEALRRTDQKLEVRGQKKGCIIVTSSEKKILINLDKVFRAELFRV